MPHKWLSANGIKALLRNRNEEKHLEERLERIGKVSISSKELIRVEMRTWRQFGNATQRSSGWSAMSVRPEQGENTLATSFVIPSQLPLAVKGVSNMHKRVSVQTQDNDSEKGMCEDSHAKRWGNLSRCEGRDCPRMVKEVSLANRIEKVKCLWGPKCASKLTAKNHRVTGRDLPNTSAHETFNKRPKTLQTKSKLANQVSRLETLNRVKSTWLPCQHGKIKRGSNQQANYKDTIAVEQHGDRKRYINHVTNNGRRIESSNESAPPHCSSMTSSHGEVDKLHSLALSLKGVNTATTILSSRTQQSICKERSCGGCKPHCNCLVLNSRVLSAKALPAYQRSNSGRKVYRHSLPTRFETEDRLRISNSIGSWPNPKNVVELQASSKAPISKSPTTTATRERRKKNNKTFKQLQNGASYLKQCASDSDGNGGLNKIEEKREGHGSKPSIIGTNITFMNEDLHERNDNWPIGNRKETASCTPKKNTITRKDKLENSKAGAVKYSEANATCLKSRPEDITLCNERESNETPWENCCEGRVISEQMAQESKEAKKFNIISPELSEKHHDFNSSLNLESSVFKDQPGLKIHSPTRRDIAPVQKSMSDLRKDPQKENEKTNESENGNHVFSLHLSEYDSNNNILNDTETSVFKVTGEPLKSNYEVHSTGCSSSLKHNLAWEPTRTTQRFNQMLILMGKASSIIRAEVPCRRYKPCSGYDKLTQINLKILESDDAFTRIAKLLFQKVKVWRRFRAIRAARNVSDKEATNRMSQPMAGPDSLSSKPSEQFGTTKDTVDKLIDSHEDRNAADSNPSFRNQTVNRRLSWKTAYRCSNVVNKFYPCGDDDKKNVNDLVNDVKRVGHSNVHDNSCKKTMLSNEVRDVRINDDHIRSNSTTNNNGHMESNHPGIADELNNNCSHGSRENTVTESNNSQLNVGLTADAYIADDNEHDKRGKLNGDNINRYSTSEQRCSNSSQNGNQLCVPVDKTSRGLPVPMHAHTQRHSTQTFHKGIRLHNYVKPQDRYKTINSNVKHPRNLSIRWHSAVGAIIDTACKPNLNLKTVDSKNVRQRVLTKMVESNHAEPEEEAMEVIS